MLRPSVALIVIGRRGYLVETAVGVGMITLATVAPPLFLLLVGVGSLLVFVRLVGCEVGRILVTEVCITSGGALPSPVICPA